jgi:hypothetical protein
MKYEIIKPELGSESVKRINDDGSVSFIPMDLENPDYVAYLNDSDKL